MAFHGRHDCQYGGSVANVLRDSHQRFCDGRILLRQSIETRTDALELINFVQDRFKIHGRLMADAKQRRFDVVAVWKIDRFGRSLKHLVNALAELESLGIAFLSLKDSLDLTTASGRLLFQLVAAMAEFERSLIQERVRAGIRNARNKGRILGRPRLEVDSGRIA